MRSLISSGSNSFNYHRDENLFLSLLSLFNNYPGNNQHAERDYSLLCFLQKNNKEELSIVIDIRNISTLILIVPRGVLFHHKPCTGIYHDIRLSRFYFRRLNVGSIQHFIQIHRSVPVP